jgi:hypothetical protein
MTFCFTDKMSSKKRSHAIVDSFVIIIRYLLITGFILTRADIETTNAYYDTFSVCVFLLQIQELSSSGPTGFFFRGQSHHIKTQEGEDFDCKCGIMMMMHAI